MIIGTGKPLFVSYTDTGEFLYFTPDKFYQMIKRDKISSDMIKDSERSDDRKLISVGEHLTFTYRFFLLTYDEIVYLKKFRRQRALFQPHLDYASDYYVNIISVIEKKMDGMNDRYIVELTLRTIRYEEYGQKYESWYKIEDGEYIVTNSYHTTNFYFEIDFEKLSANDTRNILFSSGQLDTKGLCFEITSDRRLKYSKIDTGAGTPYNNSCYTDPISSLAINERHIIFLIVDASGNVGFFLDGFSQSLAAGSDTAVNTAVHTDDITIGRAHLEPEVYADMKEAKIRYVKQFGVYDYKGNEEKPINYIPSENSILDWSGQDNHGEPIVSDIYNFFNRNKLDF